MTNCNCIPIQTSKGQIAHSTECIYFISKKYKIIVNERIPDDTIFFLDTDNIQIKRHTKKDGTLDYRYSANKWQKGIADNLK